MKYSRARAGLLAAASTLCAHSAHAAVIVSGETGGVNPDDIAINPDVTGQDIVLGRLILVNDVLVATPDGELTVNGEGAVTSVSTDQATLIGVQQDTIGTLNVAGDGTAGSASFQSSVLRVGGFDRSSELFESGLGILNIGNGGEVIADNANTPDRLFDGLISIGGSSGACCLTIDGNGTDNVDGIVNVDGIGSRLRGETLLLGDSTLGLSGELNVTNGGAVILRNEGANASPIARLVVSENSSVFVDGEQSLITTDNFAVGFPRDAEEVLNPSNAPAKLLITNGGRVEAVNVRTTGANIGRATTGEVIVRGPGSQLFVGGEIDPDILEGRTGDLVIGVGEWDGDTRIIPGNGSLTVENQASVVVSDEIFVGGSSGQTQEFLEQFGISGPPSNGALTVRSGATVEAQRVNVLENGILSGSGGSIFADVFVDGGTLAPGDSPGSMLIDGDLEFASTQSLLQIEIAGLLNTEFDILEITGDLIAENGFTLELSFLDGFAPEENDAFEFLRVGGDSLLDFALVNVITNGLIGDFDFAVNAVNGVFSLTTLNVPDPSEVPIPSAFILMASGLVGVRLLKGRKPK